MSIALNIKDNGYAFALGAAIIWSGFILVSRLGGTSDLNAFDVIAIRYLSCSLIVLPFWWFKFRFNLFNVKLITCSLVGGLGFALFTFHGFQLASAAQAAILLPGLMPIFILIFAVWINKERPSINKLLGITVITLGVSALLIPIYLSQSSISLGQIYLILGGLCWSVFSVLVKRWGITPWQATVSLAVITCLIYLPFYIAFAPKQISLELWQDIAIQGIYQGFLATIVQMLFYVRAVQLIGPSSVGSVMAIVPLVSGVAAIFFFDEPLSITLISALLLVSLGSLLVHSQFNLKRIKHAIR